MEKELTLKVLSPASPTVTVVCDSVNLTVCDNSIGKGGGSYGIHKGHAHALIALGEGAIFAKKNGKEVYRAQIAGGFATVLPDIVTVTVQKFI